jgi:hypothetical protein
LYKRGYSHNWEKYHWLSISLDQVPDQFFQVPRILPEITFSNPRLTLSLHTSRVTLSPQHNVNVISETHERSRACQFHLDSLINLLLTHNSPTPLLIGPSNDSLCNLSGCSGYHGWSQQFITGIITQSCVIGR